MLELEIESIRLKQETDQRAIVLKTKDYDQYLVIFIGHFEVESIRLKLMNIDIERPLTHDLLVSIIENLGASVENIIITELKNDTFYAQIIMTLNGSLIKIDSRPSDALALAVRLSVPILVTEEVMDKAGIFIDHKNDPNDKKRYAQSIDPEELESLSAFTDFIDSLDLGDIGN